MSFILEALKKSEKANKKNVVPNLQTNHQPPPPQPKKRTLWPLLLGAALLLNALLLLWFIAPWKKDALQPGGTASTSPNPGNVQVQSVVPPASPSPNRSVLVAADTPHSAAPLPEPSKETPPAAGPISAQARTAKPAPVTVAKKTGVDSRAEHTSTRPAASLPETVKEASPAVAPVATPTRIKKPAPVTVAKKTEVDLRAEHTSALPVAVFPETEKESSPPISRSATSEKRKDPVFELDELPQQVRNGITSTHMSVHYYTDHPPSRMVRINGQILREGDRMKDGPLVEEIAPNGAILRFEGYRFRIPVAVTE